MSYTYRCTGYFESAGSGKAGLTVTVDAWWRSDGSQAVTDQAATEIAGGFYKFDFASDTLGDLAVKFKTTDTTVDAPQVAGEYKLELHRIDAAVSAIPTTPLLTNDARLDNLDAKISTRTTLGAGATSWTYNVKDGPGNNLPDVTVWVTSDIAGTVMLASGITNASGNVTFNLDAGTVYVWSQKSGYNFSNPDTEVVS
jgi:hypothetical protein